MPRALFLSPHYDDVAFSCGGTAFALAARGWTTTLCTVFTKSVLAPTGFALACQLDKGLAADVDYMGLRRREDDVAARALAFARVERLEFAEAPHRGYASAPALFGDFAAADVIAGELEARLRERVRGYDAIFAPQALGAHVDHRRVRDALLAALESSGDAPDVAWYRDAPYVLRDPLARPAEPLASVYPVTFAVKLAPQALAAKLDGCAAYATQLGFQFGGERPMRAALEAFARDEARRLERDGASETFCSRNASARIERG